MATELEKALRTARPNLRDISPLSHWVMVVMAVFNIILGIVLFFGLDAGRLSAPLLIVNSILTFEFWGMIFVTLGLAKAHSIFVNDWDMARKTLITGVAIKAAWAVALTIRSFISPGTIFLNLLWVTIALLQMGCFIYFFPPAERAYLRHRNELRDELEAETTHE